MGLNTSFLDEKMEKQNDTSLNFNSISKREIFTISNWDLSFED